MYKSLKDFIELLDSKGELVKIKEYVDPVLEIAEITDRVSKQPDGGKALLFENTGTSFPVITNMLGSKRRILYALGVESFEEIENYLNSLVDEITRERHSLIDKIKLLPQLKEASEWFPITHKGDAPCQEMVLFKPELDRLPILKCWPQDGGRFITLPMVHTEDPENGKRNVGMYRMQVFSQDSTGMHWHRHKTGARHFANCKTNQFPVAVTLGGDPVYTYVATAPIPEGIDEYLLAGFLRNKPVELTECLTQPLKVPSDCDFVIEGYIDKSEPLVIEGPFGDHTGYYSLPDLYPTFHITCISYRKNAVYPATLVGIPPQEDRFMALATEKIFSTPLKLSLVPELVDLHLPEEGCGHNFAFVSIKKSFPGEAIKVAHALWGAGQMMFNKIMIIVDYDVDVHNRESVYQAINDNYNPKRDTHFSRGPLDVLDHASPTCGFGGKVLIDATSKMIEEGGGKIDVLSDNFESPIVFTHEEVVTKGLITVIVDQTIDPKDHYTAFWQWGANCDPIRDSKFIGKSLVMDARRKIKGEGVREWPEMALSSVETIEIVDKKWDTLEIGDFIPSPSRRFLK
jgi:4-hydroxy-3-polyprenylbenzoate decarboxylase